MQWNMGSRHWERKVNEIIDMTENYSPDLLYITEANYFNPTEDYLSNVQGYRHINPPTFHNPKLKYSRIVLLVKENLNCQLIENSV